MPDVEMHATPRSPDFDRLDLQPRVSKHLLEGVRKLEDLDNWPQFTSQVRLMLDGAFPFAGAFMRAVTSLESPPTRQWLGDLAHTCETTMDLVWLFLREVWWILRMRVAGRGHDIILHVAETHTSADQRDLRVPLAWYQLERESGGRTLDRRFDVASSCAS